MRMTTKQAAKGKWDGIIAQLISEQAVSRKHGPCPICGGKDRYRFDNNRNDGDWFCSVCGVGDGFKLLTGALAIDFAEAARRVDQIVNNIETEPFKPDIDIDKRRHNMNAVWREAKHGDVVAGYLLKRGIPAEILQKATDLRGSRCLRLYNHSKEYEIHPAMVALIRNSKGVPIAIHRTYIIPGEKKQKKIMPPLENITGGCVRLGEPDDVLVLAEGIETALAGWALTGYPAWAAVSAHSLAEMKSIPRHVKRVIICADHDASFTGQAAAFICAKTMRQKLKVETEVWMSAMHGCDLLDHMKLKKVPGTDIEQPIYIFRGTP